MPRGLAHPVRQSIPLAAIAAAFIAMLAWSWKTWPDVMIDFGRELYVPWQLTEGRVFSRDLVCIYGPLSVHFNALCFALFGASLRTLVLVNALIAAFLLYLIYQVLLFLGGKVSAIVGCLVFILMFAFGQLCFVGNYNFMCPYAHEATHGVTLAMAALFLFLRWLQHGRAARAFASGFCAGLVFLTKLEPFVAVAAALSAGWIAVAACELAVKRSRRSAFALFTIGGLLPIVSAFGLLWTAMPAAQALRATLGSWLYLNNTDVLTMPFFQLGMGTANPVGTARNFVVPLIWYAVVLGFAAVVALRLPGEVARRAAAILIPLLILELYRRTSSAEGWYDAAKPLPLFMALGAVGSAALCLGRGRRAADPRVLGTFVACLFALVLLGKMIFNARFRDYGFVLAMPATLLMVSGLVDWMPREIRRSGGSGMIFRCAALTCIGGVVLTNLRLNHQYFAAKTHWIGKGPDAFRADVRASCMQQVLDWLEQRSPQRDATLAVLPEGVMINYLARLPNPTPFTSFLPPDLLMFGEHRMLAALRSSPPTYVVIAQRYTAEFGAPWFGIDYAHETMRWVRANYAKAHHVGDPPLRDESFFGMEILRYVGSPPAP